MRHRSRLTPGKATTGHPTDAQPGTQPTGPEAWGVARSYVDAAGVPREVPEATVDAVMTAMGARQGAVPDDDILPVVTVRLDRPLPALGPALLTLEDGGAVRVDGVLPPDLPAGYHRVEPEGSGVPWTLAASPGCCRGPARQLWGWAVQLYAARSARSWGIGDFGDLARIGDWARSLGAGMTLVSPLHDASPRTEPSPYFPSSRRFANPIYLCVQDLPGAAELRDVEAASLAGQALNSERRIDRERVWALKSSALKVLFERFEGDREFDRFSAAGGPDLDGFATWNALADQHGPNWHRWPEALQRPNSPAVARFAASPEGRRGRQWHAWLQWHSDRQLSAAATGLPLVHDLAVGVSPHGADAWLYQEVFSPGMRIGAPSDEFNTLGQNWGLMPWDPWRLRRDGYRPFVAMLRAAFRHAGGVRVDHVMGLFRQFWIPIGEPPANGTYVRYPHAALLDILALEAARAGAYVVGEDLGTVEQATRDELGERGVLSYRLAWFESRPPELWPRQALAAVTTHDLPTIAGVWSGADLAAQRRLGLAPDEAAAHRLRERVLEWTGATSETPVGEVVARMHEHLAAAPCDLLAASLDDVVCVEERPNMPGTVDQWPNWRLALPEPLDALQGSPLARRVADGLGRRS